MAALELAKKRLKGSASRRLRIVELELIHTNALHRSATRPFFLSMCGTGLFPVGLPRLYIGRASCEAGHCQSFYIPFAMCGECALNKALIRVLAVWKWQQRTVHTLSLHLKEDMCMDMLQGPLPASSGCMYRATYTVSDTGRSARRHQGCG